MSKFFSAIGPLLISSIVLLALYVGSYAALVSSVAAPGDPLRQPRVARYSVGGLWAETFYYPAVQVDRKLRRDYWTTPDCLRDWER